MEEEDETKLTSCMSDLDVPDEDAQSSGEGENEDEEEGSEEESDEEDGDEEEEEDGESEDSGDEEEKDDEDDSEEEDETAGEEDSQPGISQDAMKLGTPQKDSSKPSTSDKDDSSEDCLICLNSMEDVEVATPESCDHKFCLECLVEWSQNNNSCPLDRKVFNIILAYRPGKDKVFKRINVEDARMQDDDEDFIPNEEEDITVCELCRRSDREDTLLLCDGCDRGYHCECLTPPLTTIPVEEWFCRDCQVHVPRESEEEEEESDEEYVPPVLPRRHIPRTRATERVRQRIQINRLHHRRPLELESSDEDEMDLAGDSGTINTPTSGTSSTSRAPSTSRASSASRGTTRKKSTTRKKTKRRKTTKRKKTTKGRKRKSTTTKKSPRKKGRKRKTRRRKKTTTKSRRSATSQSSFSSRFSATSQAFSAPISRSIKGRIADRLGLSKPPPGRTIPMQKKVTDKAADVRRHDFGSAPLSILGDRDELIAFQDVEENIDTPHILPAARDASTVVLPPHIAIPRQPVKKPIPASRIAAWSSSPAFDIMNIIQDQTKLHMDSNDIVIKRDGSLEATKPIKTPSINKSLTDESNALTFSEVLKRDWSLSKQDGGSASPSDTNEPGGQEGSAEDNPGGNADSGNEASSPDQGSGGEAPGTEHTGANDAADLDAGGSGDQEQKGAENSPSGSHEAGVCDAGNEEHGMAETGEDSGCDQDKKSSSPQVDMDDEKKESDENPDKMNPKKRNLEETLVSPSEPQRQTAKRARKSRWSDITDEDRANNMKQKGDTAGLTQEDTEAEKKYGNEVSDAMKEEASLLVTGKEEEGSVVDKEMSEDEEEGVPRKLPASFSLSSFLSSVNSQITDNGTSASENQDKSDDTEIAFVNGACVRISKKQADVHDLNSQLDDKCGASGEEDESQSTCGLSDRTETKEGADGKVPSSRAKEINKPHDKDSSPGKTTDSGYSQPLSKSQQKQTAGLEPKEDQASSHESELGSERDRGKDNRDRYGRDRNSPESDRDRYGRQRRDRDRDRGDRRDRDRDRQDRDRDRGDRRYRDRGRDRDNQRDRRSYGRNRDDQDREEHWRSRSPYRNSKRRWEEEEKFTRAGWRTSDFDRSRRGHQSDPDTRSGMDRDRDRDICPETEPQERIEVVTQPSGSSFGEQNSEEQQKDAADSPERQSFGQWNQQDQNSGAAGPSASYFHPHTPFQQPPPPVPPPGPFRPPLFNQPPPFMDPYSVPTVPPPPPSLPPPLSLPLAGPGGFRPWLRPGLQQQEQQQHTQPPPPPPPPLPAVRQMGNLSQPPLSLPKNLNLLSIQHLEMLRKSLLMVTGGSNSNTPSGSPVTVGQEQGAHVGQSSQAPFLQSTGEQMQRQENGISNYEIDDDGEPMDLDEPEPEPEPEPKPVPSEDKEDPKVFQNRVIEEVRKAIRPYFNSRQISKAEYKEILKKCVPKVTKSGQINEKKVGNLVAAYVKKYRAARSK